MVMPQIIMQKNQILKEERRKTVAELLELLLVVQRMGHRLALPDYPANLSHSN